jgi:hypothetical protein
MPACVTDERGVPFRFYIVLVQSAVGKEAQSFVQKHADRHPAARQRCVAAWWR